MCTQAQWPSLAAYLVGWMLLLAGLAPAQSDDCNTPVPLSGSGAFAFDTTLLTTSGFAGTSGCAQLSNGVDKDGFWIWYAPSDGDFQFDTYGSNFDTILLLHNGVDCQAPCLVFNDDTNGAQSEVLRFDLVQGDPILIQVGGLAGASGSGILNIGVYSDPCDLIPDDALEENDDCSNPRPLSAGSYSNLHVKVSDWDYYSVDVPSGYILTVVETMDTGACLFSLLGSNCTTQIHFFMPDGFVYTNSTPTTQTYIIQAAQLFLAPASCGDYGFDIFVDPDPCQSQPDDLLEDNDTCGTAVPLVPGSYSGLFTSHADRDFYSLTLPIDGVFVLTETADSNDCQYQLRTANCGAILKSGGSNLAFVNRTGAPLPVILIADTWGGATESCSYYGMDVDVYPDPCASAIDDGLEANDSCDTARFLADGMYSDLLVSRNSPDQFRFCVAPGTQIEFDVLFSHDEGNINAFLWTRGDSNCGAVSASSQIAVGYSFDDNERVEWINTTGAIVELILAVNMFPFSEPYECNRYDLVVTNALDCGTRGTRFCDPMDPNSTGFPTSLIGMEEPALASGLHFEVVNGPSHEFGYLVVGSAGTEPGLALGGGRLCVYTPSPGGVGRYHYLGGARNSVGRFDGDGVLQNMVGTSMTGSGYDVPMLLPFVSDPVIASGETWYFQAWHREGEGSYNFSNAVSVFFP